MVKTKFTAERRNPRIGPSNSSRFTSEEEIDLFEEFFRTELHLQLIQVYPTRIGDCLFDSVVYGYFLAMGRNVDNEADNFTYSKALRRKTIDILRNELARQDHVDLLAQIRGNFSLHPELTEDTDISVYLDLMSKPRIEGGLWGDLNLLRYLSLSIKMPIIVYDIERFIRHNDTRSHWDTVSLFPSNRVPLVIAFANQHFFPMVPADPVGPDPESNVRDNVEAHNKSKKGTNDRTGEKTNGGGQGSSLRRLFPPTSSIRTDHVQLERFPALTGPHFDISRFPDINNPQFMDLDNACFMMLTLDLPDLFGIMARPANRNVKPKDLPEFKDWVHVISDPIVVKVYMGEDSVARENFKRKLVNLLRGKHRLALTCNENSFILSRNQVNVPIWAMSQALHELGAKICRVAFFGMKWTIPIAEPKIDHFIERYRVEMGSSVPIGRNMFDLGVVFKMPGIRMYSFSDIQSRARKYTDGQVYEMCNVEGYGSLEFKPRLDKDLRKIKLYPEVCHAVLSVIHKQNLDDMPSTMFTMRTRLNQMRSLLAVWEGFTTDIRRGHLLGTRLEVTVQAEKIVDARRLCSGLDVFTLSGIRRALGGPFDIHTMELDTFMSNFKTNYDRFRHEVHGINSYAPTIRVRTALTYVRQSIGWSGKNMEDQLQEAREWSRGLAVQEILREHPNYVYDGWEQDSEHNRELILDFITNAKWVPHPKTKNKNIEHIMLQRLTGGLWPKNNIYVDRVTAARYFITQFGDQWRQYVKANDS